ncbi:gliding motility protein GldN [bacterium]|nr:gliding motility protein GldN [bacterium]
MKVKTILTSVVLLCIATDVVAQGKPDPDQVFPTGSRYQREANIKYAKRIHRVIDNRQKQNKVMEWPRQPFSQMLWDAAMERIADHDWVQPYANDSLERKADTSAIRNLVSPEIIVSIPDPKLPGSFKDTIIRPPFEKSKITKYRIMEDWLFDANYSDFRPHIIAIGPMYPIQTESGIDLGEQVLYWLKMEDLRPILSDFRVFNPHNDAARLTYNQFFEMRHFASTIVKENNIYDMDIAFFPEFRDDGIAALLEAERIKNDLFITEHDLWEY